VISFTDNERRMRLVTRHHLGGTASDVVDAADALLAVHATDPATVYLSLLARCCHASLGDVAAALYDQRALVRMMAMRRTLFVVRADTVPVVHHAAALDVAAKMRATLLAQLAKLPTDPPVDADVARWLDDVERGVERSITARGRAEAADLSADEPRLRTSLLPTTDKAWDVRRNITSQVLALMAAEGRLVRAEPRGAWTSRRHVWEPASAWWPHGIADVPRAKTRLVELYLRRFGPATLVDVQWWTGWTATTTRAALAGLDVVDVGCGLVLADDTTPTDPVAPNAALLPALDATPMGWKLRHWFLPADSTALYDRNGNIGPTVWWDGEIIGGWAVKPDGSVVTRLLSDRGATAARAVAEQAELLWARLDRAAVTAAFPTPLERELRTS
jgi:antitoxin (DNA-binding transcriptional repressor) of toxin-antitoxin stability system